MNSINLRKNWLFIVIVFAVFLGLMVRYLDRVPGRHYCDFRVYYKAGQDFIKGKNIYLREYEAVTPYKYSPFFAFIFAPLTLLPIKTSAAVFFTVNFISLLLLGGFSFRLVQDALSAASLGVKERFLSYALPLLSIIGCVFLVLDAGQVNILMCALILAGLFSLSEDKEMLAGAFFAFAILIKYTPAVFLPYFLLHGRFKTVIWSIFFVVLFLALPALVIGISKDLFYLSSWIPSIMSTSLDIDSYTGSRNQSIYSMFLRFFSSTQYHVQFFSLSFHQALFYGRMAALLLYVVVFIPGTSRPRDRIVDFSLLMICMSLFNPNAWEFNFISLFLGYMVLVQHSISTGLKDRFILFSLMAAIFLTNITSRDILGRAFEEFEYAYSFTTIGALVMYAALLKLKFDIKA